MKNFSLNSNDDLTVSIRDIGILYWDELTKFTKQLPYGRNANRSDLSLVISEQKGTCSSKHAFLKMVADLNEIPDIKLILGLYKMTESNTPGIGNTLATHQIDYIPEAHCYLKIDGKRFDFTSKSSDIERIENVILEETEIQPKDISDFKVKYHQDFIKNWLKTNHKDLGFDIVWNIREVCISNLSRR